MTVALMISTSSFAQNIRGFYLQDVGDWLGNSVEENKILSYAQGNGFNYILFYDLGDINWSSTTEKNQLAAFIRKAKTLYNILQVGGVVEYSGYVTQKIVPYNAGRSSSLEKFDVINMEFEFWVSSSISSSYCSKFLRAAGFACTKAGAWQFAWREFKLIDDICASTGMISEYYLGWPDASQMASLASRADRLLISAYRQNDSDIYSYSKNRLKDIAAIGGTTKVMTLLSSQSSYMGPWLATHPITRPYQTLASGLNAETASFKQHISLQGYQWFTYKYLPKTVLATASITASGPTSFCPGGSVTLTANSGVSYLWSPGGQTTQAINATAAGTYSVRVTSSSGVSVMSSPVVITNAGTGTVPVITASGPTTFCPGGSVVLTSSSAPSYLWSNGATTQSITVTDPGTYTVTSGGTCGGTSLPVTVSTSGSGSVPLITASGPTTFCPGGSVVLTSSSAPSFLWSNGETTQSITVSVTGTFFVTTGGTCGGTSAAIDVSDGGTGIPPVITASGPTTFCPGGSVDLTSTSAPSYLWSNGATTQTITVSASGSFTVTTGGTCGGTSAPITVSDAGTGGIPVINASGPKSFCAGESVTLSTASAPSYLWSNGETTQSITVTTSGNYTVTTGGSCGGTSLPTTVSVLAAPAVPVITVNGSLNLCQGTILTLTSSQANGYLWSNGSTTRSIAVSAAGSYSVTAYSGSNCSASSSAKVVTILPAPAKPVITANSSTTLTTSHTSVILTSSTASAYQWTTGSSNRSITVTNQGTYRVTVTGSNGCKATSNDVTVTANGCTPPAVPTVTVNGSAVITSGQSVTLTSSGTGGWLWSNGATTKTITVSTAGVYTVRNYSKGYCYATSMPVTITVLQARMAETATEPEREIEVNIFPNPVSEKLNVVFNSSEEKRISVKMLDITGREIYSNEILATTGENKVEIDVTGMPKGIYMAYVVGENLKEVKKVIVE